MKKLISVLLVLLTISLTACAAPSNAQRYAVNGGVVGGITGAVIGHQSGETEAGAVIGAVLGSVLGYGAGNERDKRFSRPAPYGNQVIHQPQRRTQPVYVERVERVYRDSSWNQNSRGGYVLRPRIVKERTIIRVRSSSQCW